MLNKLAYKAIEDNGGGLHLFVFEDKNGDGNEKVIYEHSGYERVKGQLQDDIKCLVDGGHPVSWDGCEDDPAKDYNHMTSSEYGYSVVAACDYYGSPEVYGNIMGQSALIEFDLECDD